ncbi:thyrotropin releasing hormone [Hemicordylus capensis]|uniref:thyrotropin releasing hormone n=1 Tax=Hemicordylus capensis TaxID=884348 RepID=UPI0023037C5C|nr:thyrotropin releasing hormone [Hemicordylus capensis]
MTSAQLLLLLFSLAFTSVCVNLGQPFPEEGENEGKSHLDDIFQRAENVILRSILKKLEDDEDPNKETSALQLDWISKRQHPGKRSLYELEKRQHPGKREYMSEESYGEILKRQHPGKREEDDELADDLELQKRQHPGRRSLWDQYLDIPSNRLAYLSELSKRQHPGKRFLAYSKQQHPGKRSWDDELDGDEQDLEKRQHPGKRYLGSESPDYSVPCDPQDSFNCSKGSLLLELLDNVSKGRVEEKRQHPGRRSLWDGEVEAEE